jgi:hypothetical protein
MSESVYKLLKAAGVPLDHHESDLYAKVTPESRAIVADYEHRANVKTFRSETDKGEFWYDIPFAYEPWWEARTTHRAGKASEALVKKLHPSGFDAMSPRMAALVGCVLGHGYTEPALVELTVTSDGILLARAEGDIGMNEFIGPSSEFRRNWEKLLDAADLTPAERAEAEALYAKRVRRA